ncbi:MAG: cellulose-binding protein [bacterium]|nr:cellulose-binding protein [bacterium]
MKKQSALTGVLLFLLVSCSLESSREQTIKIMPLGDSITHGSKKHNTYRRVLYHKLKESGFRVNFIGSQTTNYEGGPPKKDFDFDHEGHGGSRADQLLAGLPRWLKFNRPDIVLLQVGTNDILNRQSNRETIQDIKGIIAKLRKVNPEVKIFLSTVTPNKYKGVQETIKDLNKKIKKLPQKLNKKNSPLVIVDQYRGFYTSMDTYDGIHPNENGEEKLAVKWFKALKKRLDRG